MKKRALPVTIPKIRIAIVESDPLRIVGLKALLDPVDDFDVQVCDLEHVLNGCPAQVAILGNPCSQPFYEAMVSIRCLHYKLPVVVTGPTKDLEMMYKAVDSGVKGYVNESGQANELIRAIRAVVEGLIWVPRAVFAMFAERAGKTLLKSGQADLTSREMQVLEMLVGGRTNKEIAHPLGIEERTVKAHLAKLMRKVGVQNRVALSVYAFSRLRVTAQ